MAKSPHIAAGHETPFDRQFSVFLANRIGQFKDLLDLCSEERLEVLGLSIVDSTDWSVVRSVFRSADRAREVLRRHGIPFTESPVLLVETPDSAALRAVCGHLVRAEINVHFAYALTIRNEGNPVMVFHVEDPTLAGKTLVRHGLRLLGKEDLSGPS